MYTYLDLSSPEARTKVFPAVDVARLICTIFVVLIHVPPFTDVNATLDYGISHYIARLAVPFFFVVAGYFCFRKVPLDNYNIQVPLTYARKMFRLYVIWTCVYLLPIGYAAWIDDLGFSHGIVAQIQIILLVGYHHLWYLLGSAVAFTVIGYALQKQIKIEKILVCGLLLYVIAMLGQTYFGLLRPLEGTFVWKILLLYAKLFVTTRNGIFEGILFVGMGALFSYKSFILKKSHAIVGFSLSLLLLGVECFTIKHFELSRATDSYIFLVPATFYLFYLVSHLSVHPTRFTKQCRVYSSLIYYTHSWINFPALPIAVKVAEKIAGVEDIKVPSLLEFCIVFSGSVIVSFIITKLQEYKPFGWLKKIY